MSDTPLTTQTGFTSDQYAQEKGFPFPPATPLESLPPGLGGSVLPHFLTFAGIVNAVTRNYRYTHDEALRTSHNHALAMGRDAIIWEAIRQRQLPTCQYPWHLVPANEKDEIEAESAVKVTKSIEKIPYWQQFQRVLLDAIYFGRMAVQSAMEWDWAEGYKELVIRRWWPINGDKLVFKFSGQVGVLVHATAPVETQFTERGRAHFLTPNEREQFTIHHFEPDDMDFTQPELAGAIHGSGLRGRLYWYWWLRSQILAWLLDYLERIGAGGLTIYYYQAGNKANMEEVEAAAKAQVGQHTLLFPRFQNKETMGSGVERLEPSNAGADLLRVLITEYFDTVIRRFIIGPSLSSDVDSVGLGIGGGAADLLEGPFARLTRYDANDLKWTLTTDLVQVFYRYTCPGVRPARFEYDIDKDNAAEILEAAQAFYEMGGDIDANHLREVFGLPIPEPGSPILAMPQPMSSVGVDPNAMSPQGVPIEGTPGPVQMARQYARARVRMQRFVDRVQSARRRVKLSPRASQRLDESVARVRAMMAEVDAYQTLSR